MLSSVPPSHRPRPPEADGFPLARSAGVEHDPRSGADPGLPEPRGVEPFPERGGVDDGLVVADVDEAELEASTRVVGAAEHAARTQDPVDLDEQPVLQLGVWEVVQIGRASCRERVLDHV